jgi:hypothetical protein
MAPRQTFPLLPITLISAALAALFVMTGACPAAADDIEGPVTYGVSGVPSTVRVGIDTSIQIVATVSDTTKGNSIIVAAEYYIGQSTGTVTDPGVGNGIPMQAAYGAFDSPTEVVTATVSTAGWSSDRRIFVRAKDAAGNWGSAVSTVVTVTNDITPPGTVTDLAGAAMGTLSGLQVSISDRSSEDSSNTPVSALLDASASTVWETLHGTASVTEYVTFDLTQIESVAGIMMACGPNWQMFPTQLRMETSLDGSDWTAVAQSNLSRLASVAYLWEFEPTEAKYVKVSGPSMYDSLARRFYWQIGSAQIFTTYGMLVDLKWTAPSSDGYAGAGGTDSVSSYEIRYKSIDSTGTVATNWAGCEKMTGIGTPKLPGNPESMLLAIDSTDNRIDIGLKSTDYSGNESTVSNIVSLTPAVTAFESTGPEDAASVESTDVQTFSFRVAPEIKTKYLCFSGSSAFPGRPTAGANGRIDRTARYLVKAGATSWKPTAAQWRAIKGLTGIGGMLYWRLEGMLGNSITVEGPTRSLEFDTGAIIGLAVDSSDSSHFINLDEAVWPDKSAPITFTWLDATTAMKYFLVDVSTDQNVPLSDRKKTITFGGTGIVGESYTLTRAQWLAMRKLANTSGGTLYWRVRAKDADKALACVSEVSTLIVDSGTWTLTGPTVDSTAGTTTYSWTRTAEGITKYSIQFSATQAFPASVKDTLTIPSAPIAATSYTLKATELARLQKFAASKGGTLVWRVRGADADRAFTSYSSAASN